MRVVVIVPWRAGCLYREEAFKWVRKQYATHHPSWELVIGKSPDGPFNRAAAILDGVKQIPDADIYVVADADVWCDMRQAIAEADEHGWAVPHYFLHRLDKGSSQMFMGGFPLQGLKLDSSNKRDSKPYIGNETGTLVVVRRDVIEDVPPDRRFVGWGQEDQAWAVALRTMFGQPWRGGEDLVHLWHPPQDRQSREWGSNDNVALYRRYLKARHRPTAMRTLIEEGRMVQ